jgi:signal peptidase I
MPRPKSLFRTIAEPLAIAVALAALVRAAVHIYAIPTASMSPTLEIGDRIVVTRYLGGAPERGHVVVFRSPVDANELVVKRVIGVPGDLLDSRLGRVRIGGYLIAEPYVLREAATGAIDAQLIPRDSYYVLGDNRDDSLDSRSWGVVPRHLVVGRARLVLWSSPIDDATDVSASATSASTRPVGVPRGCRVFKWID